MIRGKKAIIAAAAAVMMAFCMTGCGGSEDDGQDVQTVPQTQASQNAQDQQTDQGNGAAQNGNYGQGSSHHGSGQSGVTDIGMDQAMAIAVARIQGATADNVMEIERDVDDGRIEYEGSIWYGGYEYEFEIDGSTGNILKWEIDD